MATCGKEIRKYVTSKFMMTQFADRNLEFWDIMLPLQTLLPSGYNWCFERLPPDWTMPV